MPEPLVQRLIEIQQAEGLSNSAFAAKLGIDQSMWWRVRCSSQRAGRKVIDGALRLYPDLAAMLAHPMQIYKDNNADQQGVA